MTYSIIRNKLTAHRVTFLKTVMKMKTIYFVRYLQQYTRKKRETMLFHLLFFSTRLTLDERYQVYEYMVELRQYANQLS